MMRRGLVLLVAFAGCQRVTPAPPAPALAQVRVRTPTTPGPTLVLLHGLGANERDLLPLADAIAPSWQAVSLRAPLELGEGRYSWFPVRFTDDGPVHDAQAAERSRVAIAASLERLRADPSIDPSRITLVGFSQGAMLSEEIARTRPELVEGAVLIGGRTLADHPAPTASARPRILIIHGTKDRVVPFAGTAKTRDVLERDGFPVELRSFEAGHEVNAEMIDAIRSWFGGRESTR